LSKLNAAGTSLLQGAFLGGKSDDWGCGIAVDSAGCAYVTGTTTFADLPVGPGYDTSYNGGLDAFALCLDLYGSAFHSWSGDLDGDGKRELVVWRPSSGWWYVLRSSTGYAYASAAFYLWGAAEDVPI